MRRNNLTKKIRLEIYKEMLSILQKTYNARGFYPHGYCMLLSDKRQKNIRYYTELYKRRPSRSQLCGAYWFYRDDQGTLKRITLLEEVIAEMEKELN